MRSVHDNIVYGYSVDCENRRIVLHTRFHHGSVDEYTDVVFTGVVAHHFERVLAGNILFDVTEIVAREVVQNWAALFAAQKNYSWPDGMEYTDAEDLIRLLESRGVRGFEIGSSYGLAGWVLAAAMELRPRLEKVQSP